MDFQKSTPSGRNKKIGSSVARRKFRPYSNRTARRFSPPETAPSPGNIRRYYKALNNLHASGGVSVTDSGSIFLPSDFFFELTRVLEMNYLPRFRYEAWRTGNASDNDFGLLGAPCLRIGHDRAGEIEEALLTIRPITEISAVAHHEIRNVLNAHGIYGEYQREDVDRKRQSATCSA